MDGTTYQLGWFKISGEAIVKPLRILVLAFAEDIA